MYQDDSEGCVGHCSIYPILLLISFIPEQPSALFLPSSYRANNDFKQKIYVNDISPMLATMDTKLHLIHLHVFKNLHF